MRRQKSVRWRWHTLSATKWKPRIGVVICSRSGRNWLRRGRTTATAKSPRRVRSFGSPGVRAERFGSSGAFIAAHHVPRIFYGYVRAGLRVSTRASLLRHPGHSKAFDVNRLSVRRKIFLHRLLVRRNGQSGLHPKQPPQPHTRLVDLTEVGAKYNLYPDRYAVTRLFQKGSIHPF